ncbi:MULTISPECIES: hypothetical protein [Flavobacterium]|uniref:Outer membrane protein beta-barrel domain-containing protein n=1 Tax=Flavobacterium hankyongi TaxID=1176532 RepID=A0ABP8ZUU5_9FLAO|nr:hypothetical protein [Flavobacterium sp. N1846]
MKNFIIYVSILILTTTVKMFGQETFEGKAKAIASQIEKITKEEKALLKLQVEDINKELENGIINREQADEKKLKLAEKSASKIENRVAAEEMKLTALVKEKVEGRITYLDTTNPRRPSIRINFRNKDTTKVSEKRTTSQFVFAAGVNNLVTNKAVAHSDYRYWGSHFYEIGVSYNTRILKNDNLLHFKYGLSLQYNNLRPTDNRYFVENGKQTNLQTAAIKLDDSRLRNVNIVAPLYLEFDFSGNKNHNDKPFFQTHKSVRVGLGGFAGFNVKTKQIIKYEENGHDYTQKEKGSFNTNDFVYGVGAYFGYKETSLYVKYDLNPLFKNNVVDQNNISLGVRFDLN